MFKGKSGFLTSSVHGFHLTFSNNYTISVQWIGDSGDERIEAEIAEVAFFRPDGKFVETLANGSLIISGITADDVARLVNIVSDPFMAPETIEQELNAFVPKR